jgi:hypothetical protein
MLSGGEEVAKKFATHIHLSSLRKFLWITLCIQDPAPSAAHMDDYDVSSILISHKTAIVLL